MAGNRKDSKGRNLRTGESERKDGYYQYRWTVNGKEKTVYATSLSDLRKKEIQIRRDIEDGMDSQAADTLTLDDLFHKWMRSRENLRETTLVRNRQGYEGCIKERLGNKKLAKIKYSDIYDLFSYLVNHKKYSENYLRQINTILQAVLEIAVKDDIIRRNPCKGVMSEISKKYFREKGKRHALTIQEQEAFIDFLAGHPVYNRWLPIFTVLFGTGLRIGEFAGLRWKDCDFENNTISVNHSYVYYNIGGNKGQKMKSGIHKPKTKNGERTIPMLSEVREAFLQAKDAQEKSNIKQAVVDGYTDFCFVTKAGNPYTSSDINHAIYSMVDKYNGEEEARAADECREPNLIRRFSVHSIRHTFASRLCENESNLKVIQELMGHRDIQTTMNVYAEATQEAKRLSIENLEGKIKLR